jgi:protein-ribulosamine 3-kinase
MFMKEFLPKIAAALSEKFESQVDVKKFDLLGGGSINEAFCLTTTAGKFFIKINSASKFPGLFEAEAKGLNILRENSSYKIPEVILNGEIDNTSFLVLEYLEKGRADLKSQEDAGVFLAKQHKVTSDLFGLDYNNYIGSLPQLNNKHSGWSEFFVQERLMPQIKLAKEKLNNSTIAGFESLYEKCDEIFPSEPPALLHGDLWSGNFMVTAKGKPSIFDPAVYFGHREMDLAMTRLFGGFSDAFYGGYNSVYPLEKGWEMRVDICNLYPFLVHVNLFGGSYVSQVNTIIQQFS